MPTYSKTQQKWMDALSAAGLGSASRLSLDQIKQVSADSGLAFPYWLTAAKSGLRVDRGLYINPNTTEQDFTGGSSYTPTPRETVTRVPRTKGVVSSSAVLSGGQSLDDSTDGEDDSDQPDEVESFIPAADPIYVPWGHYSDVAKIIKSRIFFPLFITGLSGNGKTLMTEQASSKSGREMIRANITIETDEDDLLGGFRLENGNTVWHDGPVVMAMKRGAVLLLDEIDLASNKIMCLQPVLEGKGIFLKKIGKFVKPAPGFQIIATANTKGKGSEDGQFIGTNILNEAFLERFAVTIEQPYPNEKVEGKILENVMAANGTEDLSFVDKLTQWAAMIRKTFYDGACDEVISTRRLVHIVNALAIVGQRAKAIEMCLNRFDTETKQSFMDLYSKIDETITNQGPAVETPKAPDSEIIVGY